ncbi:MAG: hypothetical protein IH851_08165 [Armatimonadetes bacterium]|nr:hypothetical protein [Armatimonadota bacterium]
MESGNPFLTSEHVNDLTLVVTLRLRFDPSKVKLPNLVVLRPDGFDESAPAKSGGIYVCRIDLATGIVDPLAALEYPPERNGHPFSPVPMRNQIAVLGDGRLAVLVGYRVYVLGEKRPPGDALVGMTRSQKLGHGDRHDPRLKKEGSPNEDNRPRSRSPGCCRIVTKAEGCPDVATYALLVERVHGSEELDNGVDTLIQGADVLGVIRTTLIWDGDDYLQSRT